MFDYCAGELKENTSHACGDLRSLGFRSLCLDLLFPTILAVSRATKYNFVQIEEPAWIRVRKVSSKTRRHMEKHTPVVLLCKYISAYFYCMAVLVDMCYQI